MEDSLKYDPFGDGYKLEFKRSIFSFQDINYVAKGEKKWFWQRRKPPVYILDHVSGIFPPGVNAVMGPSGAGKTSLLTVLAARKEVPGADGIILLNGKPLTKQFTRNSGFVTQQDILMPTLTVRENIMFSASVRLPTTISLAQKRKMVNLIVEELNLTKCADSLVGGDHIRGVSGGEKKRCSIAVELVTIPTILFLDEPTTGLDASTAHTVILLLKKLAAKGCNIIMSIHQPRNEIFKLFDTLILLSNGRVVYHDQANLTRNYFGSIGLGCDEHRNPADHFLDVIEHNSIKHVISDGTIIIETKGNSDQIDLPQKYRESLYYTKVKSELQEIRINHGLPPQRTLSKKLMGGERRTFATTFCEQLMALSRRTYINLYRDTGSFYLQIIRFLIHSTIMGLIYFNGENSAAYVLQNRSGAIYCIMMDQIMTNLSAIDLFIGERVLYLHEATNGYYRVSVYFFSKLFGDLIPMRYLPLSIVALVAYWLIGFQATLAHYLMFIFSLGCMVTAASAIVLLTSVSFKTVGVAYNFCGLYLLMLMVLGGYFVNVDSIPYIFRWIKFLSIFRYGYNVLLINEIKDQKYCDRVSDQTSHSTSNQTCVYGNDFLEAQGIAYESLWDLWSNNVALLGMTFLFWSISYIQLLRLKKNAKG